MLFVSILIFISLRYFLLFIYWLYLVLMFWSHDQFHVTDKPCRSLNLYWGGQNNSNTASYLQNDQFEQILNLCDGGICSRSNVLCFHVTRTGADFKIVTFQRPFLTWPWKLCKEKTPLAVYVSDATAARRPDVRTAAQDTHLVGRHAPGWGHSGSGPGTGPVHPSTGDGVAGGGGCCPLPRDPWHGGTPPPRARRGWSSCSNNWKTSQVKHSLF